MDERNPPPGTFVAFVLGVPVVLGCAVAGMFAGALADLLTSGFDGPTVFPTLLDPGTQGALIGGALGVVAVVGVARRVVRPLPRFDGAPSVPAPRTSTEVRAQATSSGRVLVVQVLVLAVGVALAVAGLP
jgi:hypothetical protein